MKNILALFCLLSLSASAFAAEPAKPQATPPLRRPLVGWRTWASAGERTFPNSPLPNDRTNAVIAVVSARNSKAAATFALRSSTAMAAVSMATEGLDGIGTDLRLVKCWYQDGNAWFSMLHAPGDPVLVPELLLHDDSLVKTDPESKSNLLRTSADGEEPAYAAPATGIVVADDADRLLPFPIAAGETRELHILLDIPADAKPGLFHGRIAVTGDGTALGHLDLNLRVLDYVLPDATSRFLGNKHTDGRKVFAGRPPALVTGDVYEPYSAAAVPPARNPAAFSILASCGLTPILPSAALDDLSAVFGSHLPKTLWVADGLSAVPGPAPDAAALAATSKKALASGIADTRVFVPSSADGGAFAAALDAVDATGAKAWAFADDKVFREMADVVTSPMRHGLPQENGDDKHTVSADASGYTEYSDTRPIERWHSLATPFLLYVSYDAGVENPDVWRRHLGLECYLLGYDGFILPSLVEKDSPWTENASKTHRSRSFLYPTRTGYIQTLAWQGVLDAVVDAKCLSAVNRLACEARYLAEKDNRIAIEGRKALSWMEWLRPKVYDPEAVRLDSLAWIDKLDAVVR